MMWRKMFEVPEIKLESQTHSQGLSYSSRRAQPLANRTILDIRARLLDQV